MEFALTAFWIPASAGMTGKFHFTVKHYFWDGKIAPIYLP